MTEDLLIRTNSGYPVAIAELRGRLRHDDRAVVRNSLRTHLLAQPAAVIVDVQHLTVPDDALAALLCAAIRCAVEVPGAPVIVLAPDPALRARLRGAGCDRHAVMVADRAAAETIAATYPVPNRVLLPELPPDPVILRAVRRAASSRCLAWGVGGAAAAVELVASELVTNAIEHARTPADVTIALRERQLHIAVRDGSPFPPRRLGSVALTAPGGRGLLVVDGLSSGWGHLPVDGGKIVWATVPVGAPPAGVAAEDAQTRPRSGEM